MIFRLLVPANRIVPLRWVADIIFTQMLGFPVNVEDGQGINIELRAEGKTLVMRSQFPDLTAAHDCWIDQMPSAPLEHWGGEELPELAFEAPLPVLFGKPAITMSESQIQCGIDILGTAFFMLSRFEELALPDRDHHDRFPAQASLAWSDGFLYRPVVDEYVEVLFAFMKRLWPAIERKRREGQVKVSCDVDQPFDGIGKNLIMLLRVMRHELFLKHRPVIAARRMANFVAHRFGSRRFDPFYNFEWYMNVCERHGRQAAFYFIADHSDRSMDGSYEIDDPRILVLLGEISRRGHEIGMHGSYNTYRDGIQIAKERNRLQVSCSKIGLDTGVFGNRQHYLRWDAGETPDYLEAAGFEYDATGSFADRPGFRYGTSHTFPMWSWKKEGPLRLKQRPLVLMERSVLSESFLNLGHSSEALDLMQALKSRSIRYGGDFNLLWHNSELISKEDREFFEAMIT